MRNQEDVLRQARTLDVGIVDRDDDAPRAHAVRANALGIAPAESIAGKSRSNYGVTSIEHTTSLSLRPRRERSRDAHADETRGSGKILLEKRKRVRGAITRRQPALRSEDGDAADSVEKRIGLGRVVPLACADRLNRRPREQHRPRNRRNTEPEELSPRTGERRGIDPGHPVKWASSKPTSRLPPILVNVQAVRSNFTQTYPVQPNAAMLRVHGPWSTIETNAY